MSISSPSPSPFPIAMRKGNGLITDFTPLTNALGWGGTDGSIERALNRDAAGFTGRRRADGRVVVDDDGDDRAGTRKPDAAL